MTGPSTVPGEPGRPPRRRLRRAALLILAAALVAGGVFLAFRESPYSPDEICFVCDATCRNAIIAAVMEGPRMAPVRYPEEEALRRHPDWAKFEDFLNRPTERTYLILLASDWPSAAKHRVAFFFNADEFAMKDEGMRALGKLTWMTNTVTGQGKPTPLLTRLDNSDPEIRRLAALVLGTMRDYSKETHAELERRRDKDPDAAVREAARKALEILDAPPK